MKTFFFISVILVTVRASIRQERNALPQEIYREDVEPAKGGKTPESAQARADLQLNMIDTAGLRDPEGIRMEQMMAAESPELLDHMLQETDSNYQPGLTPALRLKPGYARKPAQSTAFTAAAPAAPAPVYATQPAYGSPQPAYTPEPYSPPAPVGPVLLESRPHDPKSIEALPISVSETYTNFDCRSKPYPGRHYADAETGCEIYHFCHEDGKQDTFQCGYGTVFNEYIGTCDFKSSVQCTSGEGYAPAAAHYQPPAQYQEPVQYHQPATYAAPIVHAAPAPYKAPAPYATPAPYTAPAPYAVPAPYAAPAPYAEPAPYHQPAQYHQPATYHQPAPYQAAGSPLPALPALKPFTNF